MKLHGRNPAATSGKKNDFSGTSFIWPRIYFYIFRVTEILHQKNWRKIKPDVKYKKL